MAMTMKDIFGEKKSGPAFSQRKVEVTVRVTNPRTKAVVEFGVPTSLEGFDESVQRETFAKLAEVFAKWGFEPKPDPDVVEAVQEANASTDESPRSEPEPAPEEQTPAPCQRDEPWQSTDVAAPRMTPE